MEMSAYSPAKAVEEAMMAQASVVKSFFMVFFFGFLWYSLMFVVGGGPALDRDVPVDGTATGWLGFSFLFLFFPEGCPQPPQGGF